MRVTLDGFGEVPVATTFWRRWRGLRGSPSGSALLLRARSVHGIGMDRPLLVVALDGSMTVIGAAVLRRYRLVTFRRAHWLLELPAETPPPPPGTRLLPNG